MSLASVYRGHVLFMFTFTVCSVISKHAMTFIPSILGSRTSSSVFTGIWVTQVRFFTTERLLQLLDNLMIITCSIRSHRSVRQVNNWKYDYEFKAKMGDKSVEIPSSWLPPPPHPPNINVVLRPSSLSFTANNIDSAISKFTSFKQKEITNEGNCW